MRRPFAFLLAAVSMVVGIAIGASVALVVDDDAEQATTGLTSTTVAAIDTSDGGSDTSDPAPGTSDTADTSDPSDAVDTTASPDDTAAPPDSTSTNATASASAPGAGCVLSTADAPVMVAFCDTFDAPTTLERGRAGDLDPVIWGVSRTNTQFNPTQGGANDWLPATLKGCGPDESVLPPDDVRICDGLLLDALSDGTGQATLAMYPKQPFDFADRTGTLAFDVSADSQGTHTAWPEFWITDKPVPAPHATLPAQFPHARHSFGFSIAQDCGNGETGIDMMAVTRNYIEEFIPFERTDCVRKGSLSALNHFEVRVSQQRVEVWGSDPGSTDVRLLAFSDNADLSFTRGLVWIEDVHYNACKAPGTQCDHTLAWDNLGWDGPAPYRDLSFDVLDANLPLADGWSQLGYLIDPEEPRSFDVHGVFWDQPATGAIATFNWFPFTRDVPRVRLNDGEWIDTPWPFLGETFGWRTIDIPVPVEDVRTGTNTLELAYANGGTTVSNINLILIAGAPAPAPVPAG